MIFSNLPFGKSHSGHDIHTYQTGPQAKQWIYLIAGTHGDEPEGIFVLDQLFSWLKTIPNSLNLSLIVIPILNPDGVLLNTRTNARGIDLNRNLPTTDWTADAKAERYNPGQSPLSELENQYLVALLDYYPPGLILSFHSWKPLLDYNGDCQSIAHFLSSLNGYPVSDYIGYPTPGSFGTFVHEKYQTPVLTFECPEKNENLTVEKIWLENEKALKELFTSELLIQFNH